MLNKIARALILTPIGVLAALSALASGPNFNDTDLPAVSAVNPVFPVNVGIGTTAPQAKLEVDGNVYVKNANIGIGTTGPAAALDVGTGGIRLGGVTNTAWPSATSQWSGTAGATISYSSANVGIGTTGPQAKLEVDGKIYVHNASIGINTTGPQAALDIVGAPSSPIMIVRCPITPGMEVLNTGNVGIGTTGPQAKLEVDGNIYVQNGNIGINTTIPAASLDIVGADATSGTSNLILRDVTRTPLVTVLNNGNVGIGSTSPAQKLDLHGSITCRINPRVTAIVSSAQPAINTDTCDQVSITAQEEAITSMSANLTGTPVNFQKLIIRIKDNGTVQNIVWGAPFVSRGVTLPSSTQLAGKVMSVGFIYNSEASTWDCVAMTAEQ